MKKIIGWTKFKIFQSKDSLNSLLDDDDEDDDEDSNPWAEHENQKYSPNIRKLEDIISRDRVIQTPLGAINVDGTDQSAKLFNIWACHTNFVLKDQHFALVEKTPGVEVLQPISQYRFQIAVGYLFDDEEVKAAVEEALLGSVRLDALQILSVYRQLNPTLPTKCAEKLKESTKDINRPWVALVFPNGEIKMVVADMVDENFLSELSSLGLGQSLFGGYIDSSLLHQLE